ncbi:MAG TPA: FeoA family protein [Candidatus Krumholzibacteria bacterium]|nr:FeoA family protein [Candidatus Krumholzibacteria bacterium]
MINPKPEYLHCSLCGFEFDPQGDNCHTGCVLARHCNLVKCPSCGYEFPRPTRGPAWLQKLAGRRHGAHVHERTLLSLDEASEGVAYELVSLNGSHASRKTALAVYGLVPGCRLSLTRKRPSFIVKVGETELAFEGSIARDIFVKPVAI